jgi:hypothetical protein
MHEKRLRRTLPPLQEVIFYAQYPGTPFSNKLPPIKLEKIHKTQEFKHKKPSTKHYQYEQPVMGVRMK